MKFFTRLWKSFPIQLLILHFKENIFLTFFWLLLFGMVSGLFGKSLGMDFLFLDPEYRNQISFGGFFWLGVTFGIFTMVWQLITYMLHSFRFPFLAALERPLFIFCLNNAIFLILFIGIYFYALAIHQYENEFRLAEVILFYGTGFLLGFLITTFLITLYLNFTNANILTFIPKKVKLKKKKRDIRKDIEIKKDTEWHRLEENSNIWRVGYYLNNKLRVRPVRRVEHYDKQLLRRVFQQQHNNAFIIQIILILILFSLGFLIEYSIFRIPAAASLLLLFSTLISLIGGFNYWMGTWRVTALILVVLLLNTSSRFNILQYDNRAYGLNYTTSKAAYTEAQIRSLSDENFLATDKKQTTQILENWLTKAKALGTQARKPNLILLNVSGGGARSALWTMRVLQKIDSLLQEKLLDHTFLMTGSSGGMFSAAYYRELFYQKKLGNDTIELTNPIYLERIGSDLLNPMLLSGVVNDLFYPMQKFKAGGYTYRKDRGYYFEKQYNENTDFLLDRPLRYYQLPEQQMDIPLLIFTPTIMNDYRRLIISAQHTAYLTRPLSSYGLDYHTNEVDGIEFSRFFAGQDSENLRFTSAIRMSASFPFLFPTVYLPSLPKMEILDAGIRDNYGYETSFRFIHTFKTWLKENVHKILVINIRSYSKLEPDLKSKEEGFISKFFAPAMENMDLNMRLQEYYLDMNAHYIDDIMEGKLEMIDFEYTPYKLIEEFTLGLHLTKREKQDILLAMGHRNNQANLKKLLKLMQQP